MPFRIMVDDAPWGMTHDKFEDVNAALRQALKVGIIPKAAVVRIGRCAAEGNHPQTEGAGQAPVDSTTKTVVVVEKKVGHEWVVGCAFSTGFMLAMVISWLLRHL